jgi:glycosyltransferase involved in cell wall biosynthesis
VIEQVQTLRDRFDLEIIVVDDGSIDGTFESLRAVEGIKLERHEKNKGKGAAIATGLAKATGDIVVIQDADLEYEPKEIPVLVDPILSRKCDIVCGSRFKGNITGMTFSHYVANKILSFFTSVLYGAEVTDVMTGHHAFRASVFKELTLESTRFELELEVTVKALRKGYSICEIPTTYSTRNFGEAKIGWADGFQCLLKLLKYRLGF